jgi:poly(3-hydroxybutyrate) depolymerase
MLYETYELHSDRMAGMRACGRLLQDALAPFAPLTSVLPEGGFPHALATAEMMTRSGLTHARPSYGVDTVRVGHREVAVIEEVVYATPFGSLTRFRKDMPAQQPRVLLVAPLSGHFATLLRNTVRTLLADHDLYITDWSNARDVPVEAGRFGFDEYVEHIIQFLARVGSGAHVVAVCQPTVQALAAAAVMAEDGHNATPASVTLMAGPVDARINPTRVNELATSKPIEWFSKNLIFTVPKRHKGAGRQVYPGFVQLAAFMSMNVERHVKGHLDLYWYLAQGNVEKALAVKAFYDEYFAVLDLAAEFYIETVHTVFQDATLARNELTFRGNHVDMRAIRNTALLTVEGEHDDICSVGQTVAAHDLCTSVRPFRKGHHLQAGVGHFGVFSGRKWEGQVYPLIKNFVLANDG